MWLWTALGAIVLAWAFVTLFESLPRHIEEMASLLIWVIATVILTANNYERPVVWITIGLLIAIIIYAYKEEQKEKKPKSKKKKEWGEYKPVSKHWYYDEENGIWYN